MNIEEVIQNRNPLTPASKTIVNIMFTSRRVEEGALVVFKEHDLTHQQYNVLRILRGQQGKPANLSTIQERMIDKSSNTTRLIDKLIKKELVKRQVCEKNRRKIEVFITSKGMDLLKTLDPIIENLNKELVNNLSNKELETLNNLLDKLRKE